MDAICFFFFILNLNDGSLIITVTQRYSHMRGTCHQSQYKGLNNIRYPWPHTWNAKLVVLNPER